MWRYMTCTKLLSLLQAEALFFAPAKHQADGNEGLYRTLEKESFLVGHSSKILLDKSKSGHRNFICCWFQSAHESAAMWQLYGQSKSGFAIQCDPWWNKKWLSDDRNHTIDVGPVKYRHIRTEGIYSIFHQRPSDDDLFWYKDMAFKYEKEWRMIITLSEEQYQELTPEDKKGLRVKVKPNELIERIYLTPGMSAKNVDLWRGYLSEFGVNAEIHESRIGSLSAFI